MTDPWRLHWRDYYQILQVIPAAEREVIEGAYKRLAAKYHPDKGLGDIGKMKLLNESYDVLHNSETRARYDADWRLRQGSDAHATEGTAETHTGEDETKCQAGGARHPEEPTRRGEEDCRPTAEELHAARQKGPYQNRNEEAPRWVDKAETAVITSVLMGFPLIMLVSYLVSWGVPWRQQSAGATEDRQSEPAPFVPKPQEAKVERPPGSYLPQSVVSRADTPLEAAPPAEAGATYSTSILSEVRIEMVYIGPGRFPMGSHTGSGDEKPVHTVHVTRPFWMGKYEVTQFQYEAVTATNPSHFRGLPNLPVERVSWNDAVVFCRKLTDQERQRGRLPAGYVYRLPTEVEWEYAARGGSRTRGFEYAGSNMPDDVAWYESNSDRKPHPVGQKKPNEVDLYDMSGNVWEWCHDWYGPDYYDKSPAADATGPSSGSGRVVRGGFWGRSSLGCRSSGRDGLSPELRYDGCGFRVVISLPLD